MTVKKSMKVVKSPKTSANKSVPQNKLYVPEPKARPGEIPDFSNMVIPEAGALPRPAVDVHHDEIAHYADDMIRVLDDKGKAVGEWDPKISPALLIEGLSHMVLTREFDDRMQNTQRVGKISFYMRSRGEEAVSIAHSMALGEDDMSFPTYRQQGILIARGYDMEKMMCQLFGNQKDPVKGRQLPVMYSSKEKGKGYFTISGNLATQYIQAVGWAMAEAYKGTDNLATAFVGDGATAEGDVHSAMVFAAVYKAPVILNIVNNQWAISSFQGIAGGEAATFARRGCGYGLPSLRVDGNDFLAVYAVSKWAAERARAGLGATVVEHVTYRAGAHSTSDDPSKYRPDSEAEKWPLGDPIERLKQHLISLGKWSEKEHEDLVKDKKAYVSKTYKTAESYGFGKNHGLNVVDMFTDVYEEMPLHLLRQRQELGV